MVKSKYNVLLMRDDTNVRRYRLNSFWIRLGIYFLVLLVFVAAAGGYAGYTYWSENRELVQENREISRELMEVRMELERLENIEQILQSNDPEELQSLIGSVTAEIESSETAPPMVNLNDVFEYVDLQQVRVDDLQAKFNGSRMRVSFHLNNLIQDGTLSGQADIELLASDGSVVDVKVNKSQLSFQIQHFKRINTSFTLPDKYGKNSLFALRLVIKNDQDQTIFSETFPLAHILA
jgi:hypothetical protein